jgi:hypothetical protein
MLRMLEAECWNAGGMLDTHQGNAGHPPGYPREWNAGGMLDTHQNTHGSGMLDIHQNTHENAGECGECWTPTVSHRFLF